MCGFVWTDILILDRIHRIDWIYCFLCFRPPAHRAYGPVGRNREMAIPLSARKRSQRSRLYYCRTMSLIYCIFIAKRTPSKRDFGFLPFFWKGKKSWESCRSCLSKIIGSFMISGIILLYQALTGCKLEHLPTDSLEEPKFDVHPLYRRFSKCGERIMKW